MADLSKLSDADLIALHSGDLSKVSNEGLMALNGGAQSPSPQAAPAPEPSLLDHVRSNLVNPMLRAGANAITSLPLMAEDAGVAVRNVAADASANGLMSAARHLVGMQDPQTLSTQITGQKGPYYPYELPSDTYKKALDSYLPPPTTASGKASEFVNSTLLGGLIPGPSSVGNLKSAVTGLAPAIEASALPDAVPRTFVPSANVKQQNVTAAQQNGLVFPPSTTNPTLSNKLMESFAGKKGTEQDARLINESGVASLARRAVGLSDDTELTPDALQSVIAKASSAKKDMLDKLGGTLNLDDQFQTAVAKIAEPYQRAAASLGPRFSDPKLLDTVEALSKPNLESDVATTAIDQLRDDAAEAFRKGQGKLGVAYKAIATNLENAIDRHLVAQGDAGAVDAYRSARELQAKAFDIKNSLNEATGMPDARYFANKLKRNGYLSGDLLTIGNAARIAPKAFLPATDSGSVRNTDVFLGLGAAAMEHSIAPLAYPFARQGMRQYLLSGAGQARAFPGAAPMPSTGLAGLSQSLIAQWDLAQ